MVYKNYLIFDYNIFRMINKLSYIIRFINKIMKYILYLNWLININNIKKRNRKFILLLNGLFKKIQKPIKDQMKYIKKTIEFILILKQILQ